MEQTKREQELEQAMMEIFTITKGSCCTELDLNRIRSICRAQLENTD